MEDILKTAHTTAEIVAALFSTLAVLLLVIDRLRRPLNLSGYLSISSLPYEGAAQANGYLFSNVGEHLALTRIRPTVHLEMALIPKQSVAQRRNSPVPLTWTRGWLDIRAVAVRGHSGDEPLFTIAVRPRAIGGPMDRFARILWGAGLVTKGVLPYRSRGGRFRLLMATPESNILEVVTRRAKPKGP